MITGVRLLDGHHRCDHCGERAHLRYLDGTKTCFGCDMRPRPHPRTGEPMLCFDSPRSSPRWRALLHVALHRRRLKRLRTRPDVTTRLSKP